MSNSITTAMVFAAGLGKRMRPITNDIPKPLIEVAGISMLERIVEGLKNVGVKRCIVNVHYLSECVVDFVRKFKNSGIEVVISDESRELLDTGGGVKNALSLIDSEEFLVINGDVVFPQIEFSLKQLLNAWDKEKMDLLMLLHDKNKAIGYDGNGDFNLLDSREVVRNEECDNRYAFTGAQILKSSLFNGIYNKVFSLREVYFDGKNAVYGVENLGDWLHVGTPDNLKQAEEYFYAGKNI